VKDPYEPNDDIEQADPNGNRYVSKAPSLTTASKRVARIAGTVDAYEDPRDVFRVWLPANSEVSATLKTSSDGDVALYSTAALSVTGRASTGRLANAATKGTVERLRFRNATRGRWGYVVVKLPAGTLDTTYRLELASARLRAV